MRQEKQNKGGKKHYLKDFRKTADGTYLYCGKLYALHGDKEISFLLRSGILSCGALLLVVFSGLISGAGMDHTPYVLLPYAFLVGTSGSIVWAFFRLVFADRPVREYVYQSSVQSVPRRCIFTVIAAGMRLAGQIVFFLLHDPESELLVTVCDFMLSVLVIFAVLWLRAVYRRSDWRQMPERTPTTDE